MFERSCPCQTPLCRCLKITFLKFKPCLGDRECPVHPPKPLALPLTLRRTKTLQKNTYYSNWTDIVHFTHERFFVRKVLFWGREVHSIRQSESKVYPLRSWTMCHSWRQLEVLNFFFVVWWWLVGWWPWFCFFGFPCRKWVLLWKDFHWAFDNFCWIFLKVFCLSSRSRPTAWWRLVMVCL